MKNSRLIILIICVSAVLSLVSCRQYHRIVTVFEKDGSFQKIFYAKADSAFFDKDISKNPFLFNLDSCWNLTYQTEEKWGLSDMQTKFHIAKVSRKFGSLNEYNELNFNEKTHVLINPKETFRKKFRWFYTYYSYTAKYKQITDKFPVAIDNYMTQAEQNIWFQGDMSEFAGWNGYEIKQELDEIEIKFGKWLAYYMFEISFNSISYIAQNNSITHFSQMQEIKDTLFNLNFKNKREKDTYFEIFDVINMLDTFFETSDFSNLYEEKGQEMAQYFKQFSNEELLMYIFDYEIILPGKIIKTNAPVISGNTLKWQVDLFRMLPSDYILTAQSRSVNIWIFVVTGLFLIFLTFFVLHKFQS